jgi:competence protein ComEC
MLSVAVWLPLVPAPSGELEMHAIDVGQGDAIALRTPRGRWVLVDAGRSWKSGDAGRRTVVPYVRRRGGDVVLFVLSHPHEDHVGGATSVIKALRPAAYWDAAYVEPNASYRASLAEAARQRVSWRRVRPGDSMRVDGVLLRALAPDSAWTVAQEDPNEASTVVLVEYGAVRMLLTGDAEAGEEEWLIGRWGADGLRADVLKAGHHGSTSSSSAPFLDAVRPRLAIVSSGAGNMYKHPHPETLEAFAARGVIVARTDELGSIVVSTDGRRLRLAGADGAWTIPP